MHASVGALLTGIIDYAGLFPPAKLPMDEAIGNYLRYHTEPESWMLGRLVCPTARLVELSTFREPIATLPTPLAISALGRGGATAQDFLAATREDFADIARFHEGFTKQAVVEVYEAKLPAPVFEPRAGKQLFALLGAAAFLVETHGPEGVSLFFEPPSGRTSTVQLALDALAADRSSPDAEQRGRCRGLGLKLRCGGTGELPTTADLAFALTQARDRQIPLKFTAGLHHPLRNPDQPDALHGFVNVFAAGALALANASAESVVQRILEETDASRFHFDDALLSCRRLSADCAQIAKARQTLVTSFGSCSFDEPRQDLRALGLIS